MIKCLLKSLVWRILDKELRQHYIQRSHFNEYTKWMSRDFPIMEDMFEHFKDEPYGQARRIDVHREEMKEKYFPKEK